MSFEIAKESYKGAVTEVRIGQGPRSVVVGGESVPPFHEFEGDRPNRPRFALEVYDAPPTEWPKVLLDVYEEVLNDPATWAQKCANVHGADAVCLHLLSIDPIEGDTSPAEAAALALRVANAIEIPLIVYGCGTDEKDEAVLCKVAEVCSGKSLFLGPVTKLNFEAIGKAAAQHGHGVIVRTALEIPEAKELNIKLSRMLPQEKILFDPLSPALGYGMEYGYSVMEREKLAGTSFGDKNLQMPLVATLGKECWETSEAKEDGELGLMWEAMTGLTYLLAGANLLILRHPQTCRTLRQMMGADDA